MSLNAAFFAASSGLQVTARGTQVVADNIANASTEGFVARKLTQSASVLGGKSSGVQITGIDRHIPQTLLDDVRRARADTMRAEQLSNFWRNLEQNFGKAGVPQALATELVSLESALIQASTTPESSAALIRVAQAAHDVTTAFHHVADHLQTERDRADRSVGLEVQNLNAALGAISRLNSDIVRVVVTQGDVSGLVEQRQALIDQVALTLPVKEIPREFGRSTLIAADGTVLVDREAVQFGVVVQFDDLQTTVQTHERGNNVTLNGKLLDAGSDLLAGGRLAALLEIRDIHAPAQQRQLDQLAADLIQRFSGPNVDATLNFGQPGLFRDGGNPADLHASQGLSARLALSDMINPGNPQGLWRLRDGLGATSPGPVGSDATLSSLLAQLRKARPLEGSLAPNQNSFAHIADLGAEISTRRLQSETVQARTSARSEGLVAQVLAFGVDSDSEMQRLLLLEKHYAANAKVIAAVDSMLRTLLEI